MIEVVDEAIKQSGKSYRFGVKIDWSNREKLNDPSFLIVHYLLNSVSRASK